MTTWMVVEDEPDLYDMVLAMYATLGVDGVSFATGEEATEWIDAVNNGDFLDEVPELALVDIRLPGSISGPMVGAQMRQSHVLNQTVIVLMTAYQLSPQEEKSVIKQAGADLLIYKPLPKLDQFHRMLRDLIAGRTNNNQSKRS